MTQTEILNTLFKEYGLVYDQNNKRDSDVFISKNFKIITRSGIQKIQAHLDIKSEYDVVFVDPSSIIVKGTFTMGGVSTQTFGEASVDRKQFIVTKKSIKRSDGSEVYEEEINEVVLVNGNVQGNPPYLAAMAEKRALSRGVLQLAGLYRHGVFGEDEADDFRKEIKRQIEE